MSEKKPRELYKEREQRISEAISLKEPDRVPITPMSTFYHAVQFGITKKEAMYNPDKLVQAAMEVYSRYDWDEVPSYTIQNGSALDAMGVNFFKWPGAAKEKQKLKDNEPFQWVEKEYMKAEEYEQYFADPTGFLLKKILPRHYSNLQQFSEFPNIAGLSMAYFSVVTIPYFFGSPNTLSMLDSIKKGLESVFERIKATTTYKKYFKKLGFPVARYNSSFAPFDIVSDSLRGMRGSMLDMYRRPEDLKKLTNKLIAPTIELSELILKVIPDTKIVFMPLHRGADGFMSEKQFEEFYWPSLTKVWEGLINIGLIPMPFFEGSYNERLEYLTEFAQNHKGKVIYYFDQTDIIKAKEKFGDYACIRGNVPASLLIAGNPSQVETYVKTCIEGCAEGGGYLVDGGVVGIPDEAKHENVVAMTDAVHKFGVYRK
jgi:uroporphyrinogen-III decarboxylase